MTISLRPYQIDAVNRARELIGSGKRRVLIVAPTGAGKTVVAAHIIQSAFQRNSRVLFIAHRRELINQSFTKLLDAGIESKNIGVVMGNDPRRNPGACIQVASIDTLRNRAKPRADLVFFDECFPAGTRVSGRPIESYQVGDFVQSFNHETGETEFRRVNHVFRSKPSALVTVHFQSGEKLTCTAGHPVFTQLGYVQAIQLTSDHKVVRDDQAEDVLCMRHRLQHVCDARLLESVFFSQASSKASARHCAMQSLSEGCSPSGQATSPRKSEHRLLLTRVQAVISEPGVHKRWPATGGMEQKVCRCADDNQQSDALPRNTSQNERNTASDQAQAAYSWRQRQADGNPSADVSGSPAVANRTCGPDSQREKQRLARTLQDRHCSCRTHGCHRSGWTKPPCNEPTNLGPAQRRVLGVDWVDRVEVHERGSAGGFEPLCPDGLVYNLEVEGNHNYFAEGVLVHNCHRSLARSYVDVVNYYPNAVHLGLTATPYRADGKGLGDVYEEIVVVSSPRELIEEGFLVEPRVLSVPENQLPDLSKVKTRAGDYNAEQLGEAVNQKHLVGSIVEHWLEFASNVPTVCFAVNVEHSKSIVQKFIDAGIAAEHLDANTSPEDRAAILKRLNDGVTRIVSNCNVLCEGWDQPSVKCAILARPTKSTGMYLQQAGRILRPFQGVPAIILDHAGNARVHGLPQQDREFSLESKKKRAQSSSPPTRTCPSCYAILEGGTKVCMCGFEFPPPPITETNEIDGRLEVVKDDINERRAFYMQCVQECERRGNKPGRAAYLYKEKYGVWPPNIFKQKSGPRLDADINTQYREWVRLRELAQSRNYRPGFVEIRFREAFGRNVPIGEFMAREPDWMAAQ